ncbi:MAG: hypothetical protein PHC91_08060 [Eubacteriales bacterium]|nr:hypothetical protein [Eubacteriales bacterium]
MKTVVPIRNKQAVKEFIRFTNRVSLETGGNYGAIATNTNGMMEFMELLGYEGDVDELIKDMMLQHQKTPLYETQGSMKTVGYCCTPAFAAIYKMPNEMIMIPLPASDSIPADGFPVH